MKRALEHLQLRGWLCACIALTACAADASELNVSMPDRMRFDTEVYPVLMRDCAFNACHGSSERFFQVFGTGRGRLLRETRSLDPVTPAELAHSYDRARSMIDASAPERSLLLRKPLAVQAGGTGHEGSDGLGRNVYQNALEPGYIMLMTWVYGAAPTAAR